MSKISQATIVLTRTYYPEATLGKISAEGSPNIICETLERPKTYNGKENQSDNPNTSINESCCIPEGTYQVNWTLSNRLKKFTYEITPVPNRAGIRIHKANLVSELMGCIAPCLKVLDNTQSKIKKGQERFWADESDKGLQALYSFIGSDGDKQKPFTLIIKSTD